MTWSRQVWHVFRKDLRTNRVIGIVALVMLLAMSAASLRGFDPNSFQLLIASSMLPGVLFVYMIQPVFFDQPARGDVFWATQPLRPDAVAAAKLLHILLVILLLAIGMAAVLIAWRVDATAVPRLVGAKVGTLLCIAIPAAHFATLALDRAGNAGMKTRLAFAAAIILIPLALAERSSRMVQQVVTGIPTVVYALALLAAIGLLVRTYQLRERSRTVSVASTICCALLLASTFRDAAARPEKAPGSAGIGAVSFTPSFDRNEGLRLRITIAQDDPGTVQALADATVTAILRDGSRVAIPMRRARLNRDNGLALRFVTAGEATPAATPVARQRTTFDPTYVWLGDTRLDVTQVERLELDGTVETHLLHVFERYSLRDGSLARANGTEVRLHTDLFSSDTAGPLVDVRKRQLPLARDATAWVSDPGGERLDVSFALTDSSPARRTHVMVKENVSSSDGPPTLLGLGVSSTTYTLRIAAWNPTAPPVDSAWLANASLIVATPRLQYRTPFHAEAAMPPRGAAH